MLSTTDQRLKLHEVLCDILGSRNVYFQPPESVKMTYPAIVYSRSRTYDREADDSRYLSRWCYQVTLISKNPDNSVIDSLLELPYCSFDRHYAQDNLNHEVFTLYY